MSHVGWSCSQLLAMGSKAAEEHFPLGDGRPTLAVPDEVAAAIVEVACAVSRISQCPMRWL